MTEKNRNCGLILPYFGKFNNYFQLFLNSCGKNPTYDWLIFTDCREPYRYPENVHVFYTTLEAVRQRAQERIGSFARLEKPYKLCDYKPAYGLLFEEYLEQYRYWGHCDCDLLFGDLESMLTPLLEEGWDKLFAAGHLTLYRNDYDNNRRFMADYQGESIYKKVFSQDAICIFDEDYRYKENIHSIFLQEGARVYDQDLSMNPSVFRSSFTREAYSPEARDFVREPWQRARYYWAGGKILGLEVKRGKLIPHEYLYLHLQRRKMKVPEGADRAELLQILPDRFRPEKRLPQKLSQMRVLTIGWPYTYGWHFHGRRLRNKISFTIRQFLRKFGVKC